MVLVGLTGGIATGKSTVARLFQECGAALIDADILARQVVEPGKPAWRDIVRTFGRQILNPDRTLNRGALGAIVFRSPAKLRRLNAIVHPRVARAQAQLVREIARKDPHAVIIYDVPLLFEAAAQRRVDRVVVVTADRKTQIARLRRRNRLSHTEALRRIRSQMSLAKKAERADYVLDGTLPIAQLRRRVARIFEQLRRSP
ncbi:MAG: dephospho-CoA kinase [Nitrospiraceae bacterium]|nr:MAG: dephospho-CoA kinase [Nitrospiraceae bacterium]